MESAAVRKKILSEGLPALLGASLGSTPRLQRVFDVTVDTMGSHVFGVPAGVSFVRLLSQPQMLPGESRHLGAAIARIRIDGRSVLLSDPSLVNGFHEDEGTHRWTNGRGIVPLVMRDVGSVLEIEMIAVAKA